MSYNELLKILVLFVLFIFAITHLGEMQIHIFFFEVLLFYYLANLFYEENINDEFCSYSTYYSPKKYTRITWKGFDEYQKEDYNKLCDKISVRKKDTIKKENNKSNC